LTVSDVLERVLWSFAASLKMLARDRYMADVIAFRFVGRFNWTRKMLPACSVTISFMAEVLVALVNYSSRFGAAPTAPTVSSC
jgi:alpha-amylase/alpha-mannosidase (GH57 family)